MRFKVNDIIIIKRITPNSIPHRIVRIESVDSVLRCYVCKSAILSNTGRDYYADGLQYKFLVVEVTDKIYEIDIKTTRKLKLSNLEMI